MKPSLVAITIALLSLVTGCSTTPPNKYTGPNPKSPPETVLVTYHVKAGSEDQFQHVLSDVWAFYRKERLVFAEPHIIVRADDGSDKTRIIEIFTWVSHSAPEHVPTSVSQLWDQMQSLCEPRDGHPGIDGGEVDLITPQAR